MTIGGVFAFLFLLFLIWAIFTYIGGLKLLPSFSCTPEAFRLQHAGEYPKSETVPLLDTYRYTGRKNVSADNASVIYKDYPIFKISDGSYTTNKNNYEQITNNLRYWKNPDEGTCSRAEFCGALYEDKVVKSNVVLPLLPVIDDGSIRVGYYNSRHVD